MGYAEAQYTLDEVNNTTGLPPMAVSFAAVIIKNGNTQITFTVSDSVLDGHTVCYVGKVVIVRKVGSAPTSINDGTVVAIIDREHIFDYESNPYVITGYSDIAYYAFFTVSDHGVVNETPYITEAIFRIYRAAFHQDFTELDPSKTITYLNWGDMSSDARPIYTNETTGTPTYGSWENFFVLKENKPYMVKSDWTADYALDPDDYTKKLDGSASDVSNTSYSGLGAYAWMPRFYMKEVYASDGNSRDVYFSNVKEDSDFQPVGFYDYNVGEVKGVWIPMYYPGDDGKSFAGRDTANIGTVNKTTAEQKTIIDLNGANARFLGGSIMNAYRDLCYLLYKHTNIQEVGGYGACSSDAPANPVLANGVVKGFKGTGNSSDYNTRKQANKAFHCNVLFTYRKCLSDPYTLSYGNGSGQKVCIRSTNNYNLNANTYNIEGTIYNNTYRSRSSNGHAAKLENIKNKIGNSAIPSSINYGDDGGSDSTGLCDWDRWDKDSSTSYVTLRLGMHGKDSGPAYMITITPNEKDYGWGAACMLIPPANYSPS